MRCVYTDIVYGKWDLMCTLDMRILLELQNRHAKAFEVQTGQYKLDMRTFLSWTTRMGNL